ncbi:MAG: DNA-binding NtrC family response regulator [Myxococcota bacterium]|jgi:DNA-binding NtrC family response regulator
MLERNSLRIVVADAEPENRAQLSDILVRSNHLVVGASGTREILNALDAGPLDAIFVAAHLGDRDADYVLDQVKARSPSTEVIVTTEEGSFGEAVAAIKRGAIDYLATPPSEEAVVALLARITERRLTARQYASVNRVTAVPVDQTMMVGQSEAMQRLLERLERIARSEAPVLIRGETGTGKELVARWLHQRGPRAGGPFVAINCAALPDTLLEAELFGHERGAFTNAIKARKGRFQMAHGGTLFLDEVAEITPAAQAKLLRVLQEGEIEPLGSSEVVRVDVRVLSATHRDLKARISEGTFREDLYYRLKVLDATVPPLRQRTGDLHVLVDHFLERFSGPASRPTLTARAWAALLGYDYPGNVRELEHAVQHAVVLAGDDDIDLMHLPTEVLGALEPEAAEDGGFMTLPDAVREFEQEYLRRALAMADGNKTRAAHLLGISRKNLWEKLKPRL